MRHRTLILLPCFAALSVMAQEPRTLDSLRRAYAQAPHDTIRFKVLLNMAGEQLTAHPDSAFAYCLKARELAVRSGHDGQLGEVEGWLGYLEEQRGQINEAIEHYRTSLGYAEQLKDLKGIGTVLNNLAAIYKDQGRNEQALEAHKRSLAIRQELRDSSGIATSLNNIGLLLYDQGRIPEAMEHYTDALRIYERMGEQDGTSTVLHNIAGIYRDQGDNGHALTYFKRALLLNKALDDEYSIASTEDNIGLVLESMGELGQALQHYEEALRLHEKSDDPRGMGYSLRNIAGIELKRGDAASALEHAKHSRIHFENTDDKRGRASALWMTGLALEALKRAAEAQDHGKQALALARELGNPLVMRDAAQLLGRLYRHDGRWQDALEMQDVYSAMRDSVLNTETRRAAIRQQYQYAYEKKEAAMQAEQDRRDLLAREQLQREKNRRNLFLFAGVGVLALAGGLWSRLRHVRKSRAAIQKERDISESLLLNILPAQVAEELKAKGHADAKQYEKATVLFTDFKDFTGIAEQLSATDLVNEIDTCFQAFDGIMGIHGIEKIKTIGDAYMAVGGLPEVDRSKPIDVVRAALEMQVFMKQRAIERERAGLPAFHMRVGIHTGPVVAGIVGVKKFQYDIWGDTVNTASRMESASEIGRVNISEATYTLVKNEPDLAFTLRGKVSAKGKGEMEMFFVRRSQDEG